MEILPMKKEHTEKLAELEKLCFSRPWSEEALLEELTNPVAAFFTATEGEPEGEEKILGYAGMHCPGGECYLDNLAVFPQHRRQGVGKALLRALEEEAKCRGGTFLSLEVRASNESAISLYRSMGFQEAGRRKNFYTDPQEDALILTKFFE